MISLEEVRQEVIAAVKALHDSQYPGVLVNYPNFVVVDLEHQTAPFVSVEISFTSVPRAAMGELEILVQGVVSLIYYYREGRGMQGAAAYSDSINQYLAMQAIGALQYGDNQILQIQTFPGWIGSSNRVRFDVSQAVGC